MRKISITIPLDHDQLAKLRFLSERTKVPMTVYAREGIDRVLERYRPQLELSAGTGTTNGEQTPA
jgi:hypothetical protein